LAVARAYWATGKIDAKRMAQFAGYLGTKGVDVQFIAYGDGLAGFVQPVSDEPMNPVRRSKSTKEKPDYRLRVNKRHDPNVQFATLAHELAHLYLGHLGADGYLKIADRQQVGPAQRELEAEAVSYLVCRRNGVTSRAEQYLAAYVQQNTTVERMDLEAILRSAGPIEAVLRLGGLTSFGPRQRHPKRKLAVVG
jgi:hypothetical protein